MTSYGPVGYPPAPMTRSRASSTASRYTPEAYKTPDQLAQPAMSNGYPFPNGMPPHGPSPLAPMQPYGPVPAQNISPRNSLHPAAAAAANPPYPTSDRDLPMPIRRSDDVERRRHSASSAHSRRSHDSHRSRDSHRSHKSHHSHHTSSEERERRHRRHERERRKSDGYHDKPLKRVDTHRPSLGGSLFSLFDTLKDALGPRDKY